MNPILIDELEASLLQLISALNDDDGNAIIDCGAKVRSMVEKIEATAKNRPFSNQFDSIMKRFFELKLLIKVTQNKISVLKSTFDVV